MAANDTVQLAVNGVAGGEAHVHTLHFRHMAPLLTEQQLIDKWQASCRTAYRALFTAGDSPCVRYVARQVCGAVPLRAAAEESEVAGSIAGTASGTGDRLPTWTAAVASVRTAFGGKSRRGRFYIGGLMEIDSTDNYLTGTKITILQAYVDALMNTFGPGGTEVGNFQLVVHSRTLALPGVDCQDSSAFVSTIRLNSLIGSMRSRKPGHGT